MTASPIPKVTVILPTYNRAALLARSIRSVLRQTFSDFELLVIDDASTDDSVAVVQTFSDPRIRLIRFESNSGVSAARNAGIEQARGQFIAFQDSDDEWLPEKLEHQLAYLEKHADIDLVFCSLIRIDAKSRFVRLKPAVTPPADKDLFMQELLKLNFMWTQTWLMRISVFNSGLRFDTRMKRMVDWNLVLTIQRSQRTAYMAEALVIAHVTEGSLVSDEKQRGHALQALISNHLDLMSKYPAVYALHSRRLAVWSAFHGELASARYWAWHAVKLAPNEFKNIFVWLLAIAGRAPLVRVFKALQGP